MMVETTATPSEPRTTNSRALLVTVFTLQFLVALDMSLVNIALPAISADLGFSTSGLQWVITAYLLTFAGFMLLGGRLGDLWGRRNAITVGLGVFGAASVIGGLAQTPGMLIGARAAQGVAGALIAPAALAIVATIADPALKKKAMGLWGGAGAAGGAAGVVLSGLLTDWFGWRAVLFVNLPIVAVALMAALAGVGSAAAVQRPPLDIAGASAVTLGVAGIVYGVSSSGQRGWVSAETIGGLVIGVLCLVAFVIIERRVAHPLMPLSILERRSVLGANIFGFMLLAGQLAAFYFCSLYIQTIWNVEPSVAGLLFLPFCFFIVVGIIVGNKLSAIVGARHAIAMLGMVGAAGLGCFALAPMHFNFWQGILAPSFLAALGIGGSMVLVGTAGTEGVDERDIGVTSGVLNSTRQLGGTIGLAVLVTVAAEFGVPRDGYLAGFAVGALFLVAGSVAAWLILPARNPDAGHGPS